MIKMLKTVRGASDTLGLNLETFEKGKTYSVDTTPATSEALEANLVKGGLAEYVSPEAEKVTKVEAPERVKPEMPKARKRVSKK